MTVPDMSHWVLEADEFEPEDETMTEQEMDTVCQNLLASTAAYQRGEVPMRETLIQEDGQSMTYWRFVDGLAADRYQLVLEPKPNGKGCVAYAPDLPGCRIEAASFEEAWNLIRREVNVWMEAAVMEGRSIPARFTNSNKEVPHLPANNEFFNVLTTLSKV